jgi:hypothetical protein
MNSRNEGGQASAAKDPKVLPQGTKHGGYGSFRIVKEIVHVVSPKAMNIPGI